MCVHPTITSAAQGKGKNRRLLLLCSSIQTVYHFTLFYFSNHTLFMPFHMSVKVKVTQSCPTLRDPMGYTVYGILQARRLVLGNFSLLQEIFPTQGLNPGLLHCRRIIYQLSHMGSPRIEVGNLSLLQPDLSDPGIEPTFPAVQADSLLAERQGKPLIIIRQGHPCENFISKE